MLQHLGFLLLDVHRSTPTGSKNSEAVLAARHEFSANLLGNIEIWQSRYALEMEYFATTGSYPNVCHLIQNLSRKASISNGIMSEPDGSPIQNQQPRFQRWLNHFIAQFSRTFSSTRSYYAKCSTVCFDRSTF